MKTKLLLIIGLTFALALSGCGQKGPLTLPEEPKQNEQQHSKDSEQQQSKDSE